MADFGPAQTLRAHRSLLLAMEAVGWLHMTGKARAEFLQAQGRQETKYDDLRWYEQTTPAFPWDGLLSWVQSRFPSVSGASNAWPSTLTDFLRRHRDSDGTGLLGLLQAAHGMASGIEKNIPSKTSHYLRQDATHIWLASAFGEPRRNLLADPPEVLTPSGWRRLLDEIRRVLEELGKLGKANAATVAAWQGWRDSAIGPESFLRAAFSSTVAETRLPNNEVTLWDQSYVAAALFKAAVAGALLEGSTFPWSSKALKGATRWRLLTVAIGTDHYEARAVRIGDWVGAREAIERFFAQVRELVEVDVAVGSLLYGDTSVAVFSFPGERWNSDTTLNVAEWEAWLTEEADRIARDLELETPPLCRISKPTRSLVPMVDEIRSARSTLRVPVHRAWQITSGKPNGHVCPVCLVRFNGSARDKQLPCETCQKRRRGRLDAWLSGELGTDSIWVNEVADANGRLALVTLSLDLEPWLESSRLDSLRTQAIADWRRFNPTLGAHTNPIDPVRPFASLVDYVRRKLGKYDPNDPVLTSLHEGYRHENAWPNFFTKIVEDRSRAPRWDELNDDARAHWIVHQLFVKLASPGRLYRFWTQAEEFFVELLHEFRGIVASDPNLWRVRRLVLVPDGDPATAGWRDRDVYEGHVGGALLNVLYRQQDRVFLTTCNLARLLRPEEGEDVLAGRSVLVHGDDRVPRTLRILRVEVPKAGRLGVFHPLIPLEVSPLRFRVIVPLEAASRCVDRAVQMWEERFARVWDRLPLRVGLVGFPQKLPFQAVIEATRTVEQRLCEAQPETWRVRHRDERGGVVVLALSRSDGGSELRTIPASLPDGRRDVFYPYVRAEDDQPRFPLDFRHPDGRVYRHVGDLGQGDGIEVQPSRVATLFLDSTGGRFEAGHVKPLSRWREMRATWASLARAAPSMSALHALREELVSRREAWQGPDGQWGPDAKESWLRVVEAVLADRLGTDGASVGDLVEAASARILEWALDWHLSVLKETVSEVRYG